MSKLEILRPVALVLLGCLFGSLGFAADHRCDDSLQAAFQRDPETTIVSFRYFRRGEELRLTEPASTWTPRAQRDLCMVKLNVGSGNAGLAGAPSTTRGIGIEVCLPNRDEWNERIQAWGGGGWAGGSMGSPDQVGGLFAPTIAASV